MKTVIGIVIVLLIGGGWWYFPQQPVQDEVNNQQVVENGNLPANGDMEVMEDVDNSNKVEFNLTGKNFEYSQTEMRVKEGETVTVNFTTESGLHDWVVDEFNTATEQVTEGNTSSVTFVADKKGEFEYYCSVGNHRAEGMVGKLIVE